MRDAAATAGLEADLVHPSDLTADDVAAWRALQAAGHCARAAHRRPGTRPGQLLRQHGCVQRKRQFRRQARRQKGARNEQ